MIDVTIRPPTFSDFDAVYHLITTQNTADYGEPLVSAQNLGERWRSGNPALSTDSWVAVAPDGSLAAYADLEQYAPGRFAPWLYLSAAFPNQPISPHLLDHLEKRALAANTADTPPILIGRATDNNRLIQQLYRAAGYSQGLSFLIMEIVMAQPPQPAVWPPGVTVRPFVPGQDEQATYTADEEASLDKGYSKPMTFDQWAKRMNLNSDQFDPNIWFLACAPNGEVAGVALNAYDPAANTGWIDHLGVRRPWRKQGLGLALMLHSFTEFFRRGVQRVKLSVDSQSLTNAQHLYQRAGMTTIQHYHIFSKELPAIGR
jgi:ribosomal protein S18 acetylase RimI-like enzyme